MSIVGRAAATALVVAGSALVTAPSAAATPLLDGVYRLNFPAGQQTSFDSPSPSGPWTWLLAVRSACPANGCVATATDLDPDNPQVPSSSQMTYVFRQSGGRWISSQAQGFTCEGKKTAGISTLSFARSGDGTLSGDRTQSAQPCKPIAQVFTGFREGDLPPGVVVADPNTV